MSRPRDDAPGAFDAKQTTRPHAIVAPMVCSWSTGWLQTLSTSWSNALTLATIWKASKALNVKLVELR